MDQFQPVLHYYGVNDSVEYVRNGDFYWPGNRPPVDYPRCGHDGLKCRTKDVNWMVYVTLGSTVALGLIVIFLLIMYRRSRAERELAAMTWRIRYEELSSSGSTNFSKSPNLQEDASRGPSYCSLDKLSSTSNLLEALLLHKDDELCTTKSHAKIVKSRLRGGMECIAFQGMFTSIKTLPISKPKIETQRPMLVELTKMKDIQHEHIVRFVGACIDYPHYYIITEYCQKGNLKDILENQDVSMDNMLKLSLMHDLVKGLDYIRTSDLRSHGNLKSTNCLIDDRFVLKLTGFGLCYLREKFDPSGDTSSDHFWQKKRWTAPELLRIDSPPIQGSAKGDMYSFAIILQEMLLRKGVFYVDDRESLTSKDIIRRVMDTPDDPFRPTLMIWTDCERRINRLIAECWAENPHDRPDIQTIRKTVRLWNRANESTNLVDNLLKRLKQYAENLEQRVEERTRDYLEEKKKAESLLYSMLPRAVATQLIKGEPVKAESFESVTIFFSEIVGFTGISAESSPIQILGRTLQRPRLADPLHDAPGHVVEMFPAADILLNNRP